MAIPVYPGLRVAGDFYLNRFDDSGADVNDIIGPLNTKQFSFSATSQQFTRPSFKHDNRGAALDDVREPQPMICTMAIDDQPAEVLAAALFGRVSTLSESAGTVTDEALTAKKGRYMRLANRNVTAPTFVLTNQAGDVTYTVGTDYDLDAVVGLVFIPLTSTIGDAASLLADYQHAAVTGDQIQIGNRPFFTGSIIGKCKNVTNQKPLYLELFSVSLAPDGEPDLMAGFVTTTLKGTPKVPEGKDHVGVIEYLTLG